MGIAGEIVKYESSARRPSPEAGGPASHVLFSKREYCGDREDPTGGSTMSLLKRLLLQSTVWIQEVRAGDDDIRFAIEELAGRCPLGMDPFDCVLALALRYRRAAFRPASQPEHYFGPTLSR
jgi:hypothetical protein